MLFWSYWILWQNERNLKYIKPHNTSFAKYLADSKLRTKEFLYNKGVAVPETFFVISNHSQIKSLDFSALIPPFVIKPNFGFGWKGILIINEVDSVWNYVTNSGDVFSKEDLVKHFYEILDGFYSLSWNRDKVIIEQKIELEPSIDLIWKYGLPDVRLVVYNKVPVMAMLRIPTPNSKGKANLHSWACWAGIDIATWRLTYITQYDKYIKSVPGIWDVRWLEMPDWDEVLALWAKLQDITWIGYLACDIVFDKEKGPLLLEVNLRPWLNVQIANKAPLWARLKKVEWIKVDSVEKGVRLWKDLFWKDKILKKEVSSDKKLLWPKEYINILMDEKKHKYTANIKVEQAQSIIDDEFVRDILKIDLDEIENDSIKLKYTLLWEEKETKFHIKDLDGLNIILWKNALKGFYIDPFKYKKWELPEDELLEELAKGKNELIFKNYEDQITRIDKALIKLDRKLPILRNITPINLFEEKIKFTTFKWEYIPQFKYKELEIDLDWIEEALLKVEIWDIPLSGIYLRKKEEVQNKINYLRAFKKWDFKDMTLYSTKIFGDIMEENLEESYKVLEDKWMVEEEKEYMTYDEISSLIKKFNHIYSINIKLQEAPIVSRFQMSGDILKYRRWALVGKKELRSIVAHEIEGHYLKRVNGKKLPYRIFGSGTAGYISDEEWVAIYNQNRFLTNKDKKYYGIFENYKIIAAAKKSNYAELLEYLRNMYWDDYELIFNRLSRIKRWMPWFDSDGVFMKDVVYVNGYLNVKFFVESGWNLKDLYFGKIWIVDLLDIREAETLLNKQQDKKYPIFL